MALPPTKAPNPLTGWLNGRTQTELADAAGVCLSSVSDWLRRKQRINRDGLAKLAQATGVPLSDLLDWQEAVERPRTTRRRKTARPTHKRAGRAA